MTNKTIGLFLLATTFLSSPAGAAALTPTLDTIKREAADLSGNFVLSELTGDLPAGAVEVMIGDKSYYFMPSGENTALLATLSGIDATSKPYFCPFSSNMPFASSFRLSSEVPARVASNAASSPDGVR